MKIALGLVFALAITAPSSAFADLSINDSGVTLTVDCAKDPEVSVNGSDVNVTFVGACAKIAVTGSTNTVAIESVSKIAVTGSSNTAMIEAVDKIAVTGTSNTVTYKRAVTPKKKTKVARTGLNNSVKKVK